MPQEKDRYNEYGRKTLPCNGTQTNTHDCCLLDAGVNVFYTLGTNLRPTLLMSCIFDSPTNEHTFRSDCIRNPRGSSKKKKEEVS